ncbi:deoxyguanosinetriphosphate triphosphohydrolase [Anaeramoeba flamelloides]|uniref:Deoxyguanosinetriphosphate triphosphohydrolase n=1 Tax=Anaeramoeba flamelloides TaxID=1746091 RepID=A0ABQ8YTC0_9EUKA|nr:deoxyguanosinetriphosphate triphosphohydrolase [Anaeramoeba flamelloides]
MKTTQKTKILKKGISNFGVISHSKRTPFLFQNKIKIKSKQNQQNKNKQNKKKPKVLEYQRSDNDQWLNLISSERDIPQRFEQEGRTTFQRDYDRILFSDYFRRMQQKTQVFPLNLNTLVHNRMTHSYETNSVGRSLGQLVKQALKTVYHPPDNPKSNKKLKKKFKKIDKIVSAACLAHDLGNPPFGHSGETVIQRFWKKIQEDQEKFNVKKEKNTSQQENENSNEKKVKINPLTQKLNQCLDKGNEQRNQSVSNFLFGDEEEEEGEDEENTFEKEIGSSVSLLEKEIIDYLYFEGNSNTFRIIASQFGKRRGLYLSYSTIASTVKYPWGTKECENYINRNNKTNNKSSVESKTKTKQNNQEKLDPYQKFKQRKLKKLKSGYFERDRKVFERIFTKLSLKGKDGFYRHPLSFLVEASDDICYNVMDMEDAFKSNIINEQQISEHYENLHQESQCIIAYFESDIREKILNEPKESEKSKTFKKISPIKISKSNFPKFKPTSTKQSPMNQREEHKRWKRKYMDVGHHISKKRAILINDLIWVAYYQFCNKYRQIMEHKFFDNLLDSAFDEFKIRTNKIKSSWELFQSFSINSIYKHNSVIDLEKNGEKYLKTILNYLYDAWSFDKEIDPQIKKILPTQFFPIIKQNNKIFSKNAEFPLSYILDFISQMDDFFSLKLFEMIKDLENKNKKK